MIAWLLLAAAIAVEILSSTALKLVSTSSSGGTGPLFTGLALGGVVVSYLLMWQALRQHMEISLAYAVWSGVGTAAIATIGTVFFHESINPVKTALILIITGVVLLQLAPGQAVAADPAANVAARRRPLAGAAAAGSAPGRTW